MDTAQNLKGEADEKTAVTIQYKQFQIEEIRGCCLWEENLIQSRGERADERILEVVKP